jgi:cold shock CspA family protein
MCVLKQLMLGVLWVAFSLACVCTSSASPVRTRAIIDRGWKFLLGDDPKANAVRYDDRGWQAINLPHSFSEPYFRSPDFYVGFGWYRQHININATAPRRMRFLEFEGVFQKAEVWVNGTKVGGHEGGYTGFSLDITNALKAGDNVIAIRVNNLWDAQLNPRAGEHVFSGGIYRDVYLVETATTHVTWYGTFVTTPKVSAVATSLDVKTEVRNDSSAVEEVTLKTSILDPAGKSVANYRGEATLDAGDVVNFHQNGALQSPKLWSPETPLLYTAVSRVYVKGVLQDEYRTPFGIRWFTWTADDGLTLNGKHRYFHGADVHQDHAGWGDAVTHAGAQRDVALVKQAGFDFIRGSHYPHDPAFADACDELGIMFWSENSFWGLGGFKGDGYWNASAYPVREEDQMPFEAHVKASLEEMIRINRNHPSIIAWSMSNEPFFTERSVLPKMRNLLKEQVALSHELDPTRPAAIGGAQRQQIDLIGDLAGYNGDGARLFLHPKVANAVTEYGSAKEIRPGTYDPHLRDIAGQPQFPWRGGQAIWSMYDHGSIAGAEGTTGIVDYFRLPKRGWYWYRNALKGVPPPEWPQAGTPARLKLTSSAAVIEPADGTDDVQVVVTVLDENGKQISNTPEVTFTVIDGPGGFPTGRSITFKNGSDIPILDGQAAIEFRSYYAGTTTIQATSPGLPNERLTIVSKGAPRYVAGQTPEFLPGPYVQFLGLQQTLPQVVSNILLDRPTNASSSAADHASRLATDGDPATFWAPASDATLPQWWESDLEGIYDVSALTMRFAASGSYGYEIQTSTDDRTSWRTILTGVAEVKENSVILNLPPGTRTSGLRIVLTSMPAVPSRGLSEVTLRGARSRERTQ